MDRPSSSPPVPFGGGVAAKDITDNYWSLMFAVRDLDYHAIKDTDAFHAIGCVVNTGVPLRLHRPVLGVEISTLRWLIEHSLPGTVRYDEAADCVDFVNMESILVCLPDLFEHEKNRDMSEMLRECARKMYAIADINEVTDQLCGLDVNTWTLV